MPTAHLIHGYLGVGKTTLAKHLEHTLPAVRFSPDEWMVALHGTDPPENLFGQLRAPVEQIINDLWPRVLAAGADVILDFGFWSRTDRDDARERAAAVGATTKLYVLQCSDEVALERCHARNQNLQGSLHIADNTFERLKQRVQPPDEDELFELVET